MNLINAVHNSDAVQNLRGVQQNRHHPEGDAYQHTMLVWDAVADGDDALQLAALLHDTGKLSTQKPRRNSPNEYRFWGHAKESARIARDLLSDLGADDSLTDTVVWLCQNHMKAHRMHEMRPAKRNRLLDHPAAHLLLKLARADNLGKLADPEQDDAYTTFRALLAIHQAGPIL